MADSSGTSTSTTGRSRTVTGLFRDRDSAERAYNSLSSRGYSKDDVNVLMSEETRNKYYPGNTVGAPELGTKAWEDAGKGAVVGGAVGATLAAIAAIGTSVVFPGVGLLVAGPIAAAIAGAGAGGATGGVIGALIGAGIPEERARVYEQGIKEGGIVMGVNTRNDEDADYIASDWTSNKGEHIYR